MKRITSVVLGLAVAASVGAMGGCEADQSAPTRPRTQLNPLAPNEKAKENAEKRETESPKRDLPTSGKEYPGQSRAVPEDGASIITADAQKASKHGKSGEIPRNGTDSRVPETRYRQDTYPGPLPHLPENPGSTAMAGSTAVPGTSWSVEHSWGQGMVLQDYPHRDWPAMQTTYVAATVKHNPVYYYNLQERLPVPQNDGSYGSSWITALYETPWFYAQLLSWPVLMCIECPVGQVTSQRLGRDPTFFGHRPESGLITDTPTEGVIKWSYPFMVAKPRHDGATQSVPIAPTPGIAPPPTTNEAGSLPTQPQVEPPATTPGLR